MRSEKKKMQCRGSNSILKTKTPNFTGSVGWGGPFILLVNSIRGPFFYSCTHMSTQARAHVCAHCLHTHSIDAHTDAHILCGSLRHMARHSFLCHIMAVICHIMAVTCHIMAVTCHIMAVICHIYSDERVSADAFTRN